LLILAIITGTTDSVFDAPLNLQTQLTAQEEPAEDKPDM
jgi:hypothetical protein